MRRDRYSLSLWGLVDGQGANATMLWSCHLLQKFLRATNYLVKLWCKWAATLVPQALAVGWLGTDSCPFTFGFGIVWSLIACLHLSCREIRFQWQTIGEWCSYTSDGSKQEVWGVDQVTDNSLASTRPWVWSPILSKGGETVKAGMCLIDDSTPKCLWYWLKKYTTHKRNLPPKTGYPCLERIERERSPVAD
jgi:hypothetical protein